MGHRARDDLHMPASLAARLGHTFRDPHLLLQALTHRSYHYEHSAESSGHNERLEFLGDAVLDLVLSEWLMRSFPDTQEGTLSKWRASLVNEQTLSEVAKTLELNSTVRLGKSEEFTRDALRPRLLASVFEALIAAVYLDGGLAAAQKLIEPLFAKRIEGLSSTLEYAADFKTRLQEVTQGQFQGTVPEYKLTAADGPEHAKTFTSQVWLKQKQIGEGRGTSRKSAEQAAAQVALAQSEQWLEKQKGGV